MASSSNTNNNKRTIGSNKNNNNNGIISRVSESAIIQKGKEFIFDATYVGTKLLKSTGKAAWIAGTTLLILGVPLLIEIERDQQLADFELQQAALLGTHQ